MKRLMTLAMVVAAGCAVSASAQIAPLDKAREAAARDTAASKGTPEQQKAINMEDSKPAPPPSQAVQGRTPMAPAKSGAVKTSPAPAPSKTAAKGGKVPTPADIKKLADKQDAKPKTESKPAAKAPELAKGPERRRDPFVSPVVQVAQGGQPASCTGGKQCLAPGEIQLRGIVKSQVGWIAVVENSAHRTYFLHEKDEIFNAVVQKITKDSVIIREQTWDNLGKTSTREITKKLPA